MKDLTLPATKREQLGKKVRFLRRQGITPTHLLGHDIRSLALQCDTSELGRIIARAGTTRLINLEIDKEKQPKKVFIREIQKDPVSGQLLHVDFYQIRMDEKMRADIPIILIGEAPAMREKGRILTQVLTYLSVECLPDKLPPQIEIDLSPLEDMGQAIHVSDIVLGPDVTVTTDPELLVVKVSEVYVEKVEEAVKVEEATIAEAKAKAAAEAEAKEV